LTVAALAASARAEPIDLDKAGRRLQRMLRERDSKVHVQPVPRAGLGAAFLPIGREGAQHALAAYRSGIAVVAVGAGNRAGRQTTVGVMACETPDGAGSLLDALRKLYHKRDELSKRQGSTARVVKARYEIVSVDGETATFYDKRVKVTSGATGFVLGLTFRHRDLVFEITVIGEQGRPEAARRLARRSLELVRSVRENSPWTGLRGEAAIPVFVEALTDQRWGVRWRATRNLARFKEGTRGVEPALVRALEDASIDVRVAALRGLARSGWIVRSTPEAAARLLTDPDWEVRETFLMLYGKEDRIPKEKRIDLLVASMQDEDAATRIVASDLLVVLEAGDDIPWPVLRQTLADPEVQVRRNATKLISSSRLPSALRWGFLEQFEDPDDRRRAEEIADEGRLSAKEARHALLPRMEDPDWRVRRWAAANLHCLGPRTEDVIPALVKALKDPQFAVRLGALGSLNSLDDRVEDAVPALLPLLEDRRLRGPATSVLANLGRKAEAAVPRLEAALESDDARFRLVAAHALVQMGRRSERLLTILVQSLREGDEALQLSAAESLGEFGAAAAPYVADLVKTLEAKEPMVRLSAAEALGCIGPAAKAAIPALERLLSDEDILVRDNAQEALARIRGGER
jgi:HEAT repeat protein